MASSSFTAKQLRVTLILADGNTKFPGTNSNTLTLTGLRTIAVIRAVASLATNAEIQIFGMRPEDMNAMTVAWFNPPVILNHVVILEANNGDGWVQVFSGTIIESQPDYRGAPETCFRLQARLGYFSQVAAAEPLSYTGSAAAADIAEKIAKGMGYAFQNNGVTATLSDQYLSGTLFDQLQALCQAASIDYYIDGDTLTIVPATKARTGVQTVVLTKDTGLIGYPVLERFGVSLQCLFNPAIVGGGRVQVKDSPIAAANGLWTPYALVHALESVKPGGQWASTLSCYPVAADG